MTVTHLNHLMKRASPLFLVALLLAPTSARSDGLMFGFEGDILPDTPVWTSNPCEGDCSRRLEDGHFILEWGVMGDFVLYRNAVADPPTPAPDTFWVEWRFRSNQPRPASFSGCDGFVRIDYEDVLEIVQMYQDAVRDNEISDFVNGLDPDSFHTYRFESIDGINYTLSVDGFIFNIEADSGGDGFHSVQFGGIGDCLAGPERPVPVRNEWDFVRYGTIGSGEQIVSTDPPSGNLTAAQGDQFSNFLVTFDGPNYAYIDDISVSVTGGVAPTVIATCRLDNGSPHVLEVSIDGTLPPGETTTFTFTDPSGSQNVAYTRVVPGIPAASTWGLLVLGLSCLTAGGIIFRQRSMV